MGLKAAVVVGDADFVGVVVDRVHSGGFALVDQLLPQFADDFRLQLGASPGLAFLSFSNAQNIRVAPFSVLIAMAA